MKVKHFICLKSYNDYHKAAIWYKTLAKKKDPNAQCNVGIMYNEGHCVRYDQLEASRWFIWAADQGNSDAQYNLGMLRSQGGVLRQDKEEALQWFLKSAYQKNIQAWHKVGYIFLRGRYVVEKSTEKGLNLLEFAAKYSSIEAQVTLGEYYLNRKKEYKE